MEELKTHIEYLILQHDCVIIPDFGGFVLNRELSVIDEYGVVFPPYFKVGFNVELKFNDGLLAGLYMRRHAVSFESACREIDSSVKKIRKLLSDNKIVDFGSLGTLTLVDERIIFVPRQEKIVHPATWGFNKLSLEYLKDYRKLPLKARKPPRSYWKPLVVGAASVAAILFVTFVSPIEVDTNLLTKVQQSGFLPDYRLIAKQIDSTEFSSTVQKTALDGFSRDLQQRLDTLAVKVEEPKLGQAIKKGRSYYIVVGGDTSETRTNTLLANHRKRYGFNEAAVIQSNDRYRIYVASFDNKQEANNYLDAFRNKYPEFKDAWLYSSARQ